MGASVSVLSREAFMTILEDVSADRMAEHFVNYLFDDFNGSRHVRRVAAWVGFIVRGVERVAGHHWWVGGGSAMRQLWFSYANRNFKVKYDHKLRKQAARIGGVQIVEVSETRGKEELRVIATIRDLDEAEEFYNRAPVLFRRLARAATA